MNELFIKVSNINPNQFIAECEYLKFTVSAGSIEEMRKAIKNKIIETEPDYIQFSHIKMFLAEQGFWVKERLQDFFRKVKD